MQPEMDMGAPTERNSNLLPVKAKGEVRLRSVVSRGKRGRVCTPTRSSSFSFVPTGVSFSMASRMPVSSSPRNTLMMAGGASLAPRRQSLPALATVMRIIS